MSHFTMMSKNAVQPTERRMKEKKKLKPKANLQQASQQQPQLYLYSPVSLELPLIRGKNCKCEQTEWLGTGLVTAKQTTRLPMETRTAKGSVSKNKG